MQDDTKERTADYQISSENQQFLGCFMQLVLMKQKTSEPDQHQIIQVVCSSYHHLK